MDKKTILAIVLSVGIIFGWMFIQQVFFTPEVTTPEEIETQETEVTTEDLQESSETKAVFELRLESSNTEDQHKFLFEEDVKLSTDYFEFTFSTKGGNVKSIKLLQYKEVDGTPIEMILSGETGQYPFNIILGDFDTRDHIFELTKTLDGKYIFSKEYFYDVIYVNNKNEEITEERSFTLNKVFEIKENEYLIGFTVKIDSEYELPIETYMLEYGPQTGPKYIELNNSLEFRNFIYYKTERQDYTSKVRDSETKELYIDDNSDWAGIEGKYFVTIGVSNERDTSEMETGFFLSELEGLQDRASIYFKRILIEEEINDRFKFYIGPKKEDILSLYNSKETNTFEETGMNLDKAVKSEFWGWLANILKIPMEFFYSFSHNWGIAIILLTILIKILLFPITHKSFESTGKMQALSPKVEELKLKYKSNPQKLNQEMAALYKREGVSPLGGCLPLLLQLPIFLSLYLLFSTYFDFRGAAFIAPWITDLSSPESIMDLGFKLPFLNWDKLRLLPFIMVGTTFLQQIVSQPPAPPAGQPQKANQTKMIMMMLPLVFFFIMYNLPSGLLIYWTMQNFLSFGQMFYINKIKKKKAN